MGLMNMKRTGDVFFQNIVYLITFDRKGEESGGEKDNKLNKEQIPHDKGEQHGIELGIGKAVENAEDHVDTDTSEDTTHAIHSKINRGNPWRESGYITSDEEDSTIEQFVYKPEFYDKKHERIPSIFSF